MNNAAEIMKGYSPEIMCPVNFFQNIQDPNDIDWNDCSAHEKKQRARSLCCVTYWLDSAGLPVLNKIKCYLIICMIALKCQTPFTLD